MSDPRSQEKPRPELEVRVHSLPVAQPRGGASDSKDGSVPSVTPQGASAVASGPTATPRRLGDGGPPAVVHVFSGPDDRVDGLAAYLSKLGVPCVDLDIVNFRQGEVKSSHDLSSDSLWETLRSELEGGRILALWFGTPCSTFSKARGHGPGPRPLRSVQHIYGLPKSELRESEYQQVREGTYFALKTCELAQAAHRQGVCFGIENPEPWPGHVSLYLLPEMQALASLPNVSCTNFDQCCLGAETAKPTRLLCFGLDLSQWTWRCQHEAKSWRYTDWKGNACLKRGPHPPLVGRKREDGRPATAGAAAYPSKMNELLAKAIHDGLGRSKASAPANSSNP